MQARGGGCKVRQMRVRLLGAAKDLLRIQGLHTLWMLSVWICQRRLRADDRQMCLQTRRSRSKMYSLYKSQQNPWTQRLRLSRCNYLTPATCKELTCYFGATCIERGGLAVCECHTKCTEDNEPQVVCGSDGQTYKSPCDLRQLACRLQKDIVVQAFGACKDEMFSSTDWPVRRYTPLQFTQPDESNSPLSKSTRHLLVPEPDPRYYYERSGNSAQPLAPVSIPDQKSGELGISGGPQEGADVDVLQPGANIVYHTRGENVILFAK
nr:unnamed protein product [Callosobruchus chinensis]